VTHNEKQSDKPMYLNMSRGINCPSTVPPHSCATPRIHTAMRGGSAPHGGMGSRVKFWDSGISCGEILAIRCLTMSQNAPPTQSFRARTSVILLVGKAPECEGATSSRNLCGSRPAVKKTQTSTSGECEWVSETGERVGIGWVQTILC
jgi:hypothetical protein